MNPEVARTTWPALPNLPAMTGFVVRRNIKRKWRYSFQCWETEAQAEKFRQAVGTDKQSVEVNVSYDRPYKYVPAT